MPQDFQIIPQTSLTEQELTALLEGDGPCDCIGCRTPDFEYQDDLDDFEETELGLNVVPGGRVMKSAVREARS